MRAPEPERHTDPALHLAFAHQYEVRLADHTKGFRVNAVHYFPPGTTGSGRDGPMLRVTPASGAAWTGMFAFGDFDHGLSAVYSMPDPRALCIVTKGMAYLVDSQHPATWQEIAHDIHGVHVNARFGLIVFVGTATVRAYDTTGLRWSTDVDFGGDFSIVNMSDTSLIGEAESYGRADTVHFVIDVETGTITETS